MTNTEKVLFTPDISVVVPVYNEIRHIKKIFNEVESQELPPKQVIFVDSGSTDGTIEFIEYKIQHSENNTIEFKLYINSGGMPGGNRNLGIKKASCKFIALLDAGITIYPNWLSSLSVNLKENNLIAAIGLCEFKGESNFTQAVCALSYGATKKYTLPTSIFNKDIFNQIGEFNQKLRAAEDILWLNKFYQKYTSLKFIQIPICVYSSFPKSFSSLSKKWSIYEINILKAGIKRGKYKTLILYLLVTILIGSIKLDFAIIMLVIYLVIRCIADPIYRSSKFRWWGNYPLSVIYVFIIGPQIDLTIIKTRIMFFLKNILNE